MASQDWDFSIAEHSARRTSKSGEVLSSDAGMAVLEDLIENAPRRITSESQPGFGRKKKTKKVKRPLLGYEFEEVFASYWVKRNRRRIDELIDEFGEGLLVDVFEDYSEKFVKAAMDWAIWSFLFMNADHGYARNHDIKVDQVWIMEQTETPEAFLLVKLMESAHNMRDTGKSKIDMRPVCWWDVQTHHHDVVPEHIEKLAWLLHKQLLVEAIKRLKAEDSIRLEHGHWILRPHKSCEYLRQLKRSGTWRAARAA